MDLEELNLSKTGVSGDVSGVAPLVKLTLLWLSNTSVRGDVSGVAPLVKLTELQLYNTSVSGNKEDLKKSIPGLSILK